MTARDENGGDGPRLRRYRPSDRAAVLALHERALRAAGTDPTDVPGADDLRRIPEAYLDGGEFLVVEDGGDRDDRRDCGIVAMGGLRVDGPVGTCYRMRVAPERQREGLGSLVLDGLERAARDRGVERIELTTAARQRAAMAFYPARGYERVGRRSEGDYELVEFAKALDGTPEPTDSEG